MNMYIVHVSSCYSYMNFKCTCTLINHSYILPLYPYIFLSLSLSLSSDFSVLAFSTTLDISGHDSHQHAYLSIDDLGLGVTIIDKEGVKEDYKMDQNVMVNNLKHSDKAS